MEITLSLAAISWLSVLVASIAAFALGSIWYSPILFGKVWLEELKLKDEEVGKQNMLLIFGLSFILEFVAVLFLDMIVGENGTLLSGLCIGLIVGLAWVSTSFGVNYLFSRRSLRLFLIDAGYNVTFFAMAGAILGLW